MPGGLLSRAGDLSSWTAAGLQIASGQGGGIFKQPEGLALLHGPEAVIPMKGNQLDPAFFNTFPMPSLSLTPPAPMLGYTPDMAGGGRGDIYYGDTVVQVHVDGNVLTERQLIDAVHEGLLSKGRRGAALGLENRL